MLKEGRGIPLPPVIKWNASFFYKIHLDSNKNELIKEAVWALIC